MRSLIAPALVLALATPAMALSDYYSDSGKGWWWYDRDKPEEPIEKKAIKKPLASTPAPEAEFKRRNPSLLDYTYEQLWHMHPDDFYELQESFKKRAVQEATETNVREYFELQEIARKKALAFTNTAQYVWQKYPELTTGPDYPTTNPGNLAQISQISIEKQHKLRQYQDTFALLYFTKAGCAYCEEQTKILAWFKASTGWTIKPIDIDLNPQLASKLGVTMTPSLILIQKGNQDYLPVAAGVISAAEVEDKTYRAVRLLAKEIAPEEYSIYDFQKGGSYDLKKHEFPTRQRREQRQDP